jgi:DNA (cytosine-5)-methyltransferase 1
MKNGFSTTRKGNPPRREAPPRTNRRPSTSGRPEVFRLDGTGNHVYRDVVLRDGSIHTTAFQLPRSGPKASATQPGLANLTDSAFLRASSWPELGSAMRAVRTVDLYCGCGAMSLGVWEACRSIGRRLQVVLALDSDGTAATVYQDNFPSANFVSRDINTVIDSPLGAPPSVAEKKLASEIGTTELLVAGPPCQGHSDLNNHSRRDDPKNRLYDRIARFAELTMPQHIVIENVATVVHDKARVVQMTASCLKQLGYSLDHGTIDGSRLGLPQRRRRHLLVASLSRKPDLQQLIKHYERNATSVKWALQDLSGLKSKSFLDQPATLSVRNRERLDFLFRTNRYNLPDWLRPDCHRLKSHSYRSVYGRLSWGAPAQTITGGFYCMGQGRYIHPSDRRTITAHEAARLQFIPDFFNFGSVRSRTALARLIGNAVPPKLSYVIVQDLLR